jgi:cytochrome bd-type quinol oxidase subunit 1
LEISSNRKLVIMTTTLWKSRILCRSGWLKFRHMMTADISSSFSFMSSRWSWTVLERRKVRIIFGHLERIYYWMATIWALDRASKPCYSLKQKLAV